MRDQAASGYRAVTVEEAVPAVLAAASDAGLPTGEPVVLHATNNVIVHLRPSAVLAKVTRSSRTAEKELQVATYCAARGAPVAEPADDTDVRVFGTAALPVTFWRYYVTVDAAADPAELGRALSRLHTALASVPTPVPSLRDRFVGVGAILADDAQMVALDAPHRSALRRAMHGLCDALPPGIVDGGSVLHGEPHSGNVLVTPGGVRFCDFEGVRRGPIEWDVAYLPVQHLTCFPGSDRMLVDQLRGVISAQVATLCWAKLRTLDDADQRWHAGHHLRRALELAPVRP